MNPIGGIFSIKITKDFKEQKGQLNNIMPQQNNEFGAPHQKVKEIVKFVMLIDKKKKKNNIMPRAVVVAQLVEWFLLTPEFCSSNPVIGKLLY